MSESRNPEFTYFMQEFSLMRRFALSYVILAFGLVLFARPDTSTVLIASGFGTLCGLLQLIAAHFGKRSLYLAIFAGMIIGLAALVWSRVQLFDATLVQAAAIGLVSVAFQRSVCSYLHKYAFGSVSFRISD